MPARAVISSQEAAFTFNSKLLMKRSTSVVFFAWYNAHKALLLGGLGRAPK